MKKFFTWVIGHLDEDEDTHIRDSDPAIKTLVPALKCLLKKFLDKQELGKYVVKEKTAMWQFPHNIPIHIMMTLFSDNNSIIEPILLNISVELIHYIKHYYEDPKDPKKKFQDNVKYILEMFTSKLRCIWIALGELLSREINENKVENSYQIQAIELIDFCLSDIRQHFERQGETDMPDFLRPILSSLLSGVNKLSNSMRNLENVIPALELIQKIIQVLNEAKQGFSAEHVVDLQASVSNFNSFYVELCNTMT